MERIFPFCILSCDNCNIQLLHSDEFAVGNVNMQLACQLSRQCPEGSMITGKASTSYLFNEQISQNPRRIMHIV